MPMLFPRVAGRRLLFMLVTLAELSACTTPPKEAPQADSPLADAPELSGQALQSAIKDLSHPFRRRKLRASSFRPKQACPSNPRASSEFALGFALQQSDPDAENSKEALTHFSLCRKFAPNCTECAYEMGWSYWAQSDWKKAVRSWEDTLKLDPHHLGAATYLPLAEEKLTEKADFRRSKSIHHASIGTRSQPARAPVRLTLIARFQSYNPKPFSGDDHYEPLIDSPKSARFSLDGRLVYVNSLEANKTLIYESSSLKRVGEINHAFLAKDKGLFLESTAFDYAYDGEAPENPNVFTGKPVESELTHDGRYLWIPYYRRHFDPFGTNPSAVAIVDTRSERIVRVMATGPIAKYAAASPDGKMMAISHWGDNTLSLIDITSDDPSSFSYISHLVVDEAVNLDEVGEVNRDKDCSSCLRGLAYTKDSRYLFVARMGGRGGIAVFDFKAKKPYMGTLHGMKPKPRDLQMSSDGRWLYITSTLSGYISRIHPEDAVRSFSEAKLSQEGFPETTSHAFQDVSVGQGPRSLRLSPDNQFAYAAVNNLSKIVVLATADRRQMKVVASIPADPYPVGMAISPDGKRLWVTSQGRDGAGGNSVMVFQVRAQSLHSGASK